jgi:hypothetical protein
LNAAPANPLNGGTLVTVLATGAAEPAFKDAVTGGDTDHGWVYHTDTGKIFATTKTGGEIYDEADGSNSEN